jgi:hypothetical protein
VLTTWQESMDARYSSIHACCHAPAQPTHN